MMKHQDWVSTRGYEQHLNVLTKIYTRPHYQSSRVIRQSHLANPPISRPTSPDRITFVHSKENLTMREQQILWDNYHLGKRII